MTYDEAEALALRAIHDSDGRGMIGRGRNHLHQRVARAILSATNRPDADTSARQPSPREEQNPSASPKEVSQ